MKGVETQPKAIHVHSHATKLSRIDLSYFPYFFHIFSNFLSDSHFSHRFPSRFTSSHLLFFPYYLTPLFSLLSSFSLHFILLPIPNPYSFLSHSKRLPTHSYSYPSLSTFHHSIPFIPCTFPCSTLPFFFHITRHQFLSLSIQFSLRAIFSFLTF